MITNIHSLLNNINKVSGGIMVQEISLDDNLWFYSNGKERLGGFSDTQIIALIKEGKITYGTKVCCKGLTEWNNIENTRLRNYLQEIAPPPLSGDQINNTLVWILAFAPIIGLVLEAIIAYSLYGDSYRAEEAMANSQFWYMALILNIGLCIWDSALLKKTGHNTDKYKGWVWLIPVYLFQRFVWYRKNR